MMQGLRPASALLTGLLVAVAVTMMAMAAAPPAEAAVAVAMGGGTTVDWTPTPQKGISMGAATCRATLVHLRKFVRALASAPCADVDNWRAGKRAVRKALRALRAVRTLDGCVLSRRDARAVVAALSIAHPEHLCVAAANGTATTSTTTVGIDGEPNVVGPLLSGNASADGCCRGYAPAAPGRCCAETCPKLVVLFPVWLSLPNCCASPLNDMLQGSECPGSMVYAVPST